MTRIVTSIITPKDDWTTIQIPTGSEFVAAHRYSIGIGGPGSELYIKLYWSIRNNITGEEAPVTTKEPWLVRTGSDDHGQPDPTAGTSRLPGAFPFITKELFLWLKKKTFADPEFPPNQP
ncbi:hypothetical protein [Nocardia sp. NPDC020380]|uniref:hypothetical protein n=1 Tax=Nocardia sp. NPDC020380 TaxID=3364309 RepID=UPI0037A0DC2F